jgi:crotonobetainyl-CoA:carnitine CoA-transferase CaiB-like acyl-CoA transferase
MLDSLVAWTAASLVPALNAQRPARLPPTDPGYGIFRCADGSLHTLSISGEDHLWRSLCLALGLDQFAGLSEEERIARREEMQHALRQSIAARSAADLVALLQAAKVPFAPVHRPLDVPHDPQVAARHLIVEHTTPDGGTLRYVRQPLVFDGLPTSVQRRAPALGEHDCELLGTRRARP